MTRPTDGRFTLLDLSFLIAAAALTFAALGEPGKLFWGSLKLSEAWVLLHYFALGLTLSCLAPFTLALLASGLIRRRPPFRRRLRRPGMSACCVVGLGFVILGPMQVAQYWRFGTGMNVMLWANLLALSSTREISLLVVVTWALQWLGGRWAPEPTWLDRAGRLIGILWVAVFVSNTVNECLKLWNT